MLSLGVAPDGSNTVSTLIIWREFQLFASLQNEANLVDYAGRSAEVSKGERHRRDGNGEQVRAVVGLALRSRPSVDWCGYWQRSR